MDSSSSSQQLTSLKVIGLGLGRTGTLSLCTALEILGFGPCHHPTRSIGIENDAWREFAEAAKGDASPKIIDKLYRGYESAVDYTAAILAEPLYKAYPDAKFILTVRDPTKWAHSVKQTLIRVYAEAAEKQRKVALGAATEEERKVIQRFEEIGLMAWGEAFYVGYHHGRLETDPEDELLRHNEFIKQLIPSEKLLIFDVKEGWKPLAEFLGVPEPKQPFPHTNDSNQYAGTGQEWSQRIVNEISAC